MESQEQSTGRLQHDNAGQMDNPDLYMGEAGVSCQLASFMTAVLFFFIGLLLTGSREVQFRLRVPLVFLFLSAFGFLYSVLMYANASGEVSRLRRYAFHYQMSIGNIVSEYFGVYCLVLAIPSIVLGYSPDRVLSVIVLVIDTIGFLLYHYLGFSIIERYLPTKVHLWCVVGALAVLHAAAFSCFYADAVLGQYVLSALLLAAILGITAYSLFKGREEGCGGRPRHT